MLPIKLTTSIYCNALDQNGNKQTNSFKKQKKNSKVPFEDIVVPCTLGEWMILRLVHSENKSLFLTPQQVEQIIELKQNKHFDKQSLRKFHQILISTNFIAFQSMQEFKPVQYLKQALYNAYHRNCGKATHFCKFSIYKKGLVSIEPVDSEKQQASHDYQPFNFLQGCGDSNNDNISWSGKSDFIKLPENSDKLPNQYDMTTLDTQPIKKIKEMYELYDEGLKNMKSVYKKKASSALKKYWYVGLKQNGNQNLKNQKHKKDFAQNDNLSTTTDDNTKRVSRIIGTNYVASVPSEEEEEEEANSNELPKN